MKIREDVVLGQHSHVGMARTENQDFFGYYEPDDEREFDLKGRLAVVCDGMGGHAGGEIASRLAVQTVVAEYTKDTSGNVEEALRKAVEAANAAIQREGQREPKLAGMGSTCTALVHRRDMVYFGQVGDSRGYLIRNGKIKQMTKDHSLVQELVDQGLIDKSEMESHPDKNVILRSLGVKPTVDVDVSYVPTNPGDIFLLCSDGLSGPVSEAEMLSIVMASAGDLRAASERLVELANRYGGYDNITVQLVKVVKTDTATTDKTDPNTVTAAFGMDQVNESIAKAKAEADKKKKGGKGADAKAAPAAAPAAKAPLPATVPSKPVLPATAIATPVSFEEPAAPTRAARPAASAAAAPGGGGKLVVGLLLGLALGGGGVAAAAASGKLPVGAGSSPALLVEVEAAKKVLQAAGDDMKRHRAVTLAAELHKPAQKAFEAAMKDQLEGPSDPVARLTALREAASLCQKASAAAQAQDAVQRCGEARVAAAEASRKAEAKSASPVFKRAQEELKAAQSAEASDPAGARVHYLTAAALFEVAGQSP